MVGGCCPALKPNHNAIVGLRGFGVLASNGLTRYRNHLTDQSVFVLIDHFDYAAAYTQILRANPPKIVLIGHSAGADSAIRLALSLQNQNRPVDLLILLDPTFPKAVPANVRKCVVYYVGSDSSSKRNKVKLAGENSETILIKNAVSHVNHFTIDDDQQIFDEILVEMLQALAD